jgi:hypothetical protein
MGNRDFKKRETKKPKKSEKKPSQISLEPQMTVEVIKKGKKQTEEE